MKKIILNEEKVYSFLFFSLGLFSTWSALMLPVFGMQFAFYNFILGGLILLFLYNRIKSKNMIPILKNRKLFYLFFLMLIISTMLSLNHLGGDWFKGSLRGTMKFLLLLFPFILLVSDYDIIKYRKYFIKGLYYSAMGQLVWEFLQIIVWSNMRISLNEVIMGNLLRISSPSGNWTNLMHIGGISQYRPTGIGWDTSAMALVLIIGLILAKNKYLKIGFILGILLSTSRTGIICMFLCIIMSVSYSLIVKNSEKIIILFKKHKKKIIVMISMLLFLLLMLMIIIFTNKDFANLLIYKLFNSNDELGNFSAQRHAAYYLEIPALLSKISILQILFGFGTFIAGYPYAVYFGFYRDLINWTPESDFITILFGNGIIGLVLYYGILICNLWRNRRHKSHFLIISMILIAGLFYLYIRGSWTFLVLIMLWPKQTTEIDCD